MLRLEDIRRLQIDRNVAWTMDNGYLDFVTDARDKTYWRAYVGQSKDPPHRLRQHIRAIQCGKSDTLHYYVISKGDGFRTANFVKLWSIGLPDGLDPAIKITLNNIMEMVMARSFQSLPPEQLYDAFGPPEEGTYSFFGLNIISPLLQGRSLSPWIRRELTLPLLNSSDEDIRNWPNFRVQQHESLLPSSCGKPFQRLTKEQCQNAILQAIASVPADRVDFEHLSAFDSRLLEGFDSTNFCWLEAGLGQIPGMNGSATHTWALPRGSCGARIGIILRDGSMAMGDSQDALLPSGLSQSGFNYSNCLVWSYNFRQLRSICPGSQVNTADARSSQLLHELNLELLRRSQARVLLVCDEMAQKMLLSQNLRRITFTLQGSSFYAWVDVHDNSIRRIYVDSPAPLTALWTNGWPQAMKLSKILRFSALMTGTKGILHNSTTSQLVVLQIIRQYEREKEGDDRWTPDSIDPNVLAWLEQKNFGLDDIRRLEASADSLTQAILLLTFLVPRAPVKRVGSMIPQSKHRRRNVFDKEKTARVRLLLDEVTQRTCPFDVLSENTPGYPEIDLLDQETIETQQKLEQAPFEDPEINVNDEDIARPRIRSHGRFLDQAEPANTDCDQFGPKNGSTRFLKTQMALLSGSAKSRVEYRGDGGRMYYRVYARRMEIHFQMEEIPLRKFPDPKDLGVANIKAEMAALDERHPQLWARDVQDGDPGERLAFCLTLTNQAHEKHSFYPSASGEKAAKKANSFVDWIMGATDDEIAQRPRRYLSIQSKPESTAVALKPFIAGAYTDDNGHILSKSKKPKLK